MGLNLHGPIEQELERIQNEEEKKNAKRKFRVGDQVTDPRGKKTGKITAFEDDDEFPYLVLWEGEKSPVTEQESYLKKNDDSTTEAGEKRNGSYDRQVESLEVQFPELRRLREEGEDAWSRLEEIQEDREEGVNYTRAEEKSAEAFAEKADKKYSDCLAKCMKEMKGKVKRKSNDTGEKRNAMLAAGNTVRVIRGPKEQ